MAAIEVIVPSMGESIFNVTLIKWLKNEGDFIQEDESIVEIATDKVDSEIPSPVSGFIQKILASNNTEATVGQTIAIIQTDENNITEVIKVEKVDLKPTIDEKKEIIETESKISSIEILTSTTNSDKYLSPLVREILKQEKINFTELDKIIGSGLHNRITKNDILSYLKNKSSNIETPTKSITPSVNSDIEIVEMDRMRKLIAEHMVNSVKTSPHVTSFIDVDCSDIVKFRETNKDSYLASYHSKLTYTPFFIRATIDALLDFPIMNSSLEGDKILIKKFINIGMATALPNGNLIVPIIKNADKLSFHELVFKVNDLAERARNNKLLPDEISNGTFTITNLGTFGNITGTPIINQPQVGILATGVISKKPSVITTDMGDSIGIRHKSIFSLSFDHRIIDGAMGGMFLQRVAKNIENFTFDF
ncbi:MAG TPA: 2-oxoglutarate dehydrogenase [Bacteroidales bacterium]|nr:MAG: hypothetical protein A2W98_07675 [Bacteroidetes bacterium GWF2_33_38]OFY76537.1 MAG: hypothetical protein A2265_10950 [Bacteroidetes bacterium RIFOXYA12_FULL_33_9]OFY88110.1 MAG: hypothetical protein A2236_13030 [Bacteroidetes bacterium RIFOXYA2_FULL_33_7]HBF87279.1 2-oxoglutarate dehydrogenase [Bacteroidales bacterium]